MFDFSELVSAADDSIFEEIPVGVREFVSNPNYMNLPTLSDYQILMIEMATQIYKEETLYDIMPPAEAKKRWTQTKRESIYQLGKGCHAPYTPVYNASSGKWERIDSLSSGDNLVISASGQTQYGTESFLEGHGAMLRVTTALGFVEDVHVGHRYLGYKKQRFYRRNDRSIDPTFIRADELSPGDRIGIKVNFDVSNPDNIPVEHAELIGYWLGNGMMPTDENPIVNIDFCRDEVESIDRYLELCAYIGDEPRRKEYSDKNMVSFIHGRKSNAVKLARDLGLWGMRSATKYLPDVLWKSDNTVLSAAIAKLWQADGCVYRKNGHIAEFVSISKRLAEDVQHALLRIGIPSGIRSRIPKSNFANASRAYYVTVSSEECYTAFADNIKLLDHKRPDQVMKSGRVYRRLASDTYYDRVVSVEAIDDSDFWTITVPEEGNYVGNGMISANSGKDFISTVICCYVVYLLLCLKDPQKYYDKPAGDNIDIINVAVNADQASRVFFKGVVQRLKASKWFKGKYQSKDGGEPTQANEIHFNKNINLYSGHSEREAFEGYNVIMVVLDEISAFATESKSANANTAYEVYKTYVNSVISRFPEHGKILLLSFPRHKECFISQRYRQVVAEKEVIEREEVLTINPELPESEQNTLRVKWEEDHVLSYTIPGVFALRRPSWIINPTKKPEHYLAAFLDNYQDSLGRFACMPPDAVGAFFRDKSKIDAAFVRPNGVDNETGRLEEEFVPKDDVTYYMHVDLARLHDYCAVAIAHVDKWQQRKIGGSFMEPVPVIVVDSLRFWKPTKNKSVDFAEVRDYILSVRNRGFQIGMVTFDRWESADMMKYLNSVGMKSERLSIAKKHYMDFAMVVGEERLVGPDVPELRKELLALQDLGEKIDHSNKSYKDLSDATCGAIYNAIRFTRREADTEIEVRTYDSVRKEEPNEPEQQDSVIRAPRRIPPELDDFLGKLFLA
jgi:hypothetical protein